MADITSIIAPVVTEKATAQEKNGKYQMFVRKQATKIDIKQAFKKLYGVEVVKVNVMRTSSKMKMGRTRGGMITKKPEYKKVIITTKGRKTVDLAKPKVK